MADTIGDSQIRAMLLAATGKIRANHQMLSALDSATGDGDHGTTILRTMEAVASAVEGNSGSSLEDLFAKIAWAVMGCDGGSTGPLLGSFFSGMGEAVAGQGELDAPAVVAMFSGGIDKLSKLSRAKTGDKTMMDAFLPALDAMKVAAPEGIHVALQNAAEAAARGAEATKDFRAKFGRARNLGDRVIGHADPGAVSVSLIFNGFAEALVEAS
jgi:phosphoenolpyruvate---glycerone phosphotransferase subunit DhaL